MNEILGFLPNIGWPEMLLIFGVVLMIFGPQKLPEIAEAMGKSIQKFKSAAKEAKKEIRSGVESEDDKH
jgi:sec-independent protein translocase protein TatA